MKYKKIAIVGLGLMGSSLAASLRRKFPGCRITGISRNRRALSVAKRKKLIHISSTVIDSRSVDCDLLILCTPVDTLSRLLVKVEGQLKRRTLVTDVGSTKGELQKFVDGKKWKHLSFVGSHPMVGSEKRGIDAFQPGLYDDGTVFIVKGRRTAAGDFAEIRKFWKRLCKRVVELSAVQHDAVVAEISHLPHLTAASLVNCVQSSAGKFAAAGFRDTTRIALGDESIWVPIMLSNRKPVLRALSRLEGELKKFRKSLQKGSPKGLKRLINQAKSRRSNM